jgi:demethylmenaquinone methyltransferase / 2-methoxy-6-polyprenyl-1,4-benzoquinol methylase
MAEAWTSDGGERKRHALELFSGLPRHYDRVGAMLSFGQDPRWRRALVDAVPAGPQDRVLDVATGTGMVAEALVRRYGCAVVGLDQSEPMLDQARRRLAGDDRLRARVSLVVGEAERLPFADGEFDHMTFTYLLRYVDDPAATLGELARVVRPGGRVASLEFGIPPARVQRALWTAYVRLGLPALGALVSREWRETGRFLARSIPAFYAHRSPADVAALWERAGIADVQIRPMSFGAGVVMWGTRADGRAPVA